MTEPAAAPAPAARPSALRHAAWLAPLLVLAIALHAVDAYPVGAAYDDAVYVEIAKALATGQGYRYLHLPGTPFAAHFPPGYPFFLSLLWRLMPAFPANVLLFKAANAVLVAVAAVWFARLARDRFALTAPQAAAAAVVASIGIPTLVLSALVMSEPLFLALALPALLLGERIVAGERRAGWLVGAGLLAGVATLVRTHGVALIGAVVLLLLWKRRFRDAAWYAAAAGLVIAPWQWWVYAHAGGLAAPLEGTYGPYLAWWIHAMRDGGAHFFLATVAGTTRDIAAMLAVLVAPLPVRGAGMLALVLVAALSALGAWHARRAVPVALLFLALYFAIVIVWPYSPTRFLWCVWPLLVALPLLGVRALWRWELPAAVPRRLRAWLLVAAAIPLAGYVRYNVRGYRNAWWETIPRTRGEQLRAVVMKVRDATPPGALLAGTDDAAIYLYTGRRAVSSAPLSAAAFLRPLTVTQDAQVLREILQAYPVNDVIATTRDQAGAADLLVSARPPLLALTDSFPGGLIYSTIRK